ncbi:Hypothetical protein SMAX5B_019110 [Scophthalmus maximus]|uniref:Uncharacterized protein n=1 Tax=Scophthalmus maximus TaxID=52904 RepID=A0A2U9C537_SCOMX|nr:Hypothetical protein SMAX5B_019110 [Scophthalmus maximus]
MQRTVTWRNSRHGDKQEVIVLRQGDYIFSGASGWSSPPRLIKSGLDVEGPRSLSTCLRATICRDQTQCDSKEFQVATGL